MQSMLWPEFLHCSFFLFFFFFFETERYHSIKQQAQLNHWPPVPSHRFYWMFN
jgi:hypothetical protein